MNHNVNQPNNEVVYLVPCKEQHSESQVNCASKAQADLLKLYLDNVGSANLPIVALRNEDICRKLKDKLQCNLRRSLCNERHRKKGFSCVLNSDSCIVCSSVARAVKSSPHRQPCVVKNRQSPVKTAGSGDSVLNEPQTLDTPDSSDSSSVKESQKLDLSNGQDSHYKGLNIDEFVDLLSDITDQHIITSIDKGKLLSDSAIQGSCDMSMQLKSSLMMAETLSENGKNIYSEVTDTSDIEVKTLHENNQSSMSLLDNSFSIDEFYSCKDNILDENAQNTGISGRANAAEERNFLGESSQNFFSNEQSWPSQMSVPFLKPTSPPVKAMSCDQGNAADGLFSMFQSDSHGTKTRPDVSFENSADHNWNITHDGKKMHIFQEGRSQDADTMLEKSNLENILFETKKLEESTAVYKDINVPPCTFGFENKFSVSLQEETEVSSKFSGNSSINDLISDVSEILDEINMTKKSDVSDGKPGYSCNQTCSVPQAHNQFSHSFEKTITSSSDMGDKQQYTDNFSTDDYIMESLFQTPENIQMINEDCANKGINDFPHGNMSEKAPSNDISNGLLFSKEICHQDNLEKSSLFNITKKVVGSNDVISEVPKIISRSQVNCFPTNGTSLESPGIPKRVAFKVRPAGKAGRTLDKRRATEKTLHSLPKMMRHNYLRKDRTPISSLKKGNRPETNAEQVQDVKKMYSRYANQFSNPECSVSSKYPPFNVAQPDDRKVSLENIDVSHEQNDLVLPVGETGLRVTIPNTVKTSIVSFLPLRDQTCNVSTQSVSGPVDCQFNGDNILGLSIPSAVSFPGKSSVLQHIKPDMKNNNFLLDSPAEEIGNISIDSQTSSNVTPLSSGMQMLSNISVLQTSDCNPIYVVLPPTTTSSLNGGGGYYSMPVTSMTSQAGTTKPDVISTYQFVDMENENFVQTSSQQYSMTPVCKVGLGEYPFTNVSSNIVQYQGNNGTSEPIKITIRTKPRALLPKKGDSNALSRKRDASNGNRVADKERDGLPSRGMKYTPSSMDKATRNRNLVKELKVHFPSVSEAILQQLTIPSQAVHRGYLTRHDLQNLHSQALKLHYSIIYRNHVTKCTTYDCEICRDFVSQQDSLRLAAREKIFKPKIPMKDKGRKLPKKPGKRCIRNRNPRGEDDDPTYEPPPSYFKSWKRKTAVGWCSRWPMKMMRVENTASERPKGCCLLKNTEVVGDLNQKTEGNLRRSNSEPSIAQDVKQELPEGSSRHTQDDVDVMYKNNTPLSDKQDLKNFNQNIGSHSVAQNSSGRGSFESSTSTGYQVADVSFAGGSSCLPPSQFQLGTGKKFDVTPDLCQIYGYFTKITETC